MKLLGNAVVLVAGVLVLALVTVVLLAPETVERLFAGIGAVNIALRTAAMVVINLLVLVLMYLRLRRQAAPVTGLTVQAQGALANIEVESAQTIVLRAVKDVPDVRSAEATIRAVQGRADIEVDVTIASALVNVPEKQKEINRVLRQVINKQLGLRFHGRPRVNIRLEAPVPALVSSPIEKPASSINAAVQAEAELKPSAAAEIEPSSVRSAPPADIEASAETDLPASTEQGAKPSEHDLSPAESGKPNLDDDRLRDYLRGRTDEKDNDN